MWFKSLTPDSKNKNNSCIIINLEFKNLVKSNVWKKKKHILTDFLFFIFKYSVLKLNNQNLRAGDNYKWRESNYYRRGNMDKYNITSGTNPTNMMYVDVSLAINKTFSIFGCFPIW